MYIGRRCALALSVCVTFACGSPPDAVTPRSSPSSLTLEVSASPAAEPAKVAWAWLPEELFLAYTSGELSDAMLLEIALSFEVSETITLDDEPQTLGTVDADGAGGFVVLLQPPGGHFLGSLGGNPGPGNRIVSSELVRPPSPDPITVRVALTPPAPREAPERCAGAGRDLLSIDMDRVAGEIGNDVARRVCVMLPPSYAESSPRRYPVVYLLPGYGGTDTTYRHLAALADEAILVGVDGRTRFGTTYFHDTAYAGAWEQWLERAVAEIDRRYRTVADPRRRAVLGHSTGGYNAISLAMRRTDLFMAAAASSPDGLDFGAWLFDGESVREPWLRWTQLEVALGGPGQMHSYAAQLDDASHPGALVWPFDLETGARDETAWSRWERSTPMAMLRDPAIVSRVRANLSDRLFISVGRRDAFGLFAPAELFHERLVELEIPHAWAPTDGTHFEGSSERREAGLAFLLERL